AFFAYPGKPSFVTPEKVTTTQLASAGDDLALALNALTAEVDAGPSLLITEKQKNVANPRGPMSAEGIGGVLSACLPENAIVIDESLTSGRTFWSQTAGVNPHDWLNSMGGSIGFGLPLAIGASLAAPDRKVIALEGDGSAMYTLQSLWTMAREQLDVTIVVFANRSHRTLQGELAGLASSNPGRRALDLLSLDQPELDWVGLARSQGVEAGRAANLDDFVRE